MIHARKDYNERVKCVDGSIPEDEPVFLLRAQDKTAVNTLKFWIRQQETLCNGEPGVVGNIKLAKEHVALMEAWPEKKLADAPVEEVKS